MTAEVAPQTVKAATPQATVELHDLDRILDYTMFCISDDGVGQRATLAYLQLKKTQDVYATDGSIAVHVKLPTPEPAQPSLERDILLPLDILPILHGMSKISHLTFNELDGHAVFTLVDGNWLKTKASLEKPLGKVNYPNIGKLIDSVSHKDFLKMKVKDLKAIPTIVDESYRQREPLVNLPIGDRKATIKQKYLSGILSAVRETDTMSHGCNCEHCESWEEDHELEVAWEDRRPVSILDHDHETDFTVRYLIMPIKTKEEPTQLVKEEENMIDAGRD